MVLQDFLRNLQAQELVNQNEQQLAWSPMSPEQQAWANRQKRLDPTQQNTNLNYIPTLGQINSMNALNARNMTTVDAEQMRAAREAYDNLLRQRQLGY